MKRRIMIGVAALLVVALIASSILSFVMRDAYEHHLAKSRSLKLVEMNAQSEAFLKDVRARWTLRQGPVDSYGDIFQQIGLKPTVADVTYLHTWKMPSFSYWNFFGNRRNKKFGAVQESLISSPDDGNFYVNRERSLAYMKMSDNWVEVYVDEAGGVQTYDYRRPKP